MHLLMYISAAAGALSDADLTDILTRSRRNNPAADITGMLLHIDAGFLQILEGPQHAVRETFNRIARDRRHQGHRILIERAAEARLFPEWTMGFERPLPGHGDMGGIFTATKAAIEGAVSPEQAAEIAILLRTFYRVNATRHAA